MKKALKQLSACFLAIALVFTAIPPMYAKAETATSHPSGITGLSIEDMVLLERETGWNQETEDGEEWFEYRVKSDYWSIEFDGEWYSRDQLDEQGFADYEEFDFNDGYYWINYETDQSYDNQWVDGEHTVTAKLYDYEDYHNSDNPTVICSTTFTVTIVTIPIERIAVDPVERMEGVNGYWTEDWIYDEETDSEYITDEYFRYEGLSNYNYTVYFSDDTEPYVHTDDDDEPGFYYNGYYVDVYFESDQGFNNQWETGNTYQVDVIAGNYKTTYDFTIKSLPIESIEFEPVETYPQRNGYWDWDYVYDEESESSTRVDYYRYYLSNPNFTVKFSDGTEDYVHIAGDEEEGLGFYYDGQYIELEFDTDPYQDAENQWKAGNTYTVNVTAGSYQTSYEYKILPSPVKSVKIKDKKLFVNTGGYYSEYEGDDEYIKWYKYDLDTSAIPFTVEFADGTIAESDWEGDIRYDDYWHHGKIVSDQTYRNPWGIGEHEATLNFMGYQQKFKVIIVCEEHQWDNGTTTAAATCTSKGTITYKCNNCDETKTVLTEKTGHQWNKNYTVDKEATCTAAGSKSIHCANCKATKDAVAIPVKAHKEVEFGAKEATCTAAGMTAGKKCAVCDKVTVAPTAIPAKGHKPGAAATCTAPQTCTVCQAMLAAPTGHTAGPEATCTTAQNCAACGVELEKVKGHAVALTTKTKATPDDNGEIVETCICGQVMNASTISMVKNVKLSKEAYVYNGKAQKPAVTVKDSTGKDIVADNYTVTYKNNTKVGKATVTVKFKGDYSGTKTLNFTINPKAPAIKKPVAGKKAVTVKWAKVAKEATGYEVMVATNKKFTQGKKTATIKKAKTITKKMTGLKAKKTYYVKVRSYKTVKGVKYYSAWSAVKTCKTK